MKKSEFLNKVKRRLGWPMVKVELCDDQIIDNLEYARDKYIKWAVGNATDLIYFTIQLEGGKKFYDLPKGVIDIISYDEDAMGMNGGINTLFTVENYLFNQGYYDPIFQYPNSMLGFHMVLDFMENLDRYMPNRYSWRYHKKTNQLELNPTPKYGEQLVTVNRVDPFTNTVKSYLFDSPGYALLKANVIEGTTLPFVIREWDHVMKELVPGSELRLINDIEANNDYFVLSSPSVDKLEIFKNGALYTKWQWYDDNKKIIKWVNKEEVLLNDEILCKYKTYNIYPSNDSYSYVDAYQYKIDTYTVSSVDILNKSFILSEKTIKKEDVTIAYNGSTYTYGTGFLVDTDNQTILFGGKLLDGILVNTSVITISFPDESSNMEEYDESLYDNGWILDYVVALSKITLGIIRRKFASFSSIGNTGIALDGDFLVSEGQQDKENLEEVLRSEESYEGGYITMG